jgi:hypothetical protein
VSEKLWRKGGGGEEEKEEAYAIFKYKKPSYLQGTHAHTHIGAHTTYLI